ncbi:MAG: amidohydrolase family protein, partial [Conexibacter sp.]
MLVFQDACVVAMDDGPARRPHHDVIVDGDRIVSIQPTGSQLPDGADVLDAEGMFLIPGLIDTHAHVWHPALEETIHSMSREEINRGWLNLLLINGVTTVLNLHGTPDVVDAARRIQAGKLCGPTIHSAGPILNDASMTYEQALAEVAEEAEIGYEYVKVYNDLPVEAYRGIVEAAPQHGLQVLGHIPEAVGFEGVLASGQIAIVHGEELLYNAFDPYRASRDAYDWTSAPPLRIEELPRVCAAIAEAGVTVMPNLCAFYAIWQQGEQNAAWLRSLPEFELIPAELFESWSGDNDYARRYTDPAKRRGMFEGYWFQIRLVESLHRAGVRLTTGTDFPVPGIVPGLLHFELAQLAGAGLGNEGALRAGTRAGGDRLEPGSGLGTIVPGARADLALLAGDPLEDIRNTKTVRGVMTRGIWYDADNLAARERKLR